MKTKVWAVVPAKNVEKSISNTLRQLNRAGIQKTIVICNGCTDNSKLTVLETIPNLNMEVSLLEFLEPLGHDVPRAYGAIYAYRKKNCSHLLFIDGDLSGSFGPMLKSYLEEYLERDINIMWAPISEKAVNYDYLEPWQSAKQQIPTTLCRANPAVTPIMVSMSTFSLLSPFWLHHPGKWFAYAIQAKQRGLHLGVGAHWDIRLTGHVLKDYSHNKKMKETLLGDAAEGACILTRRPLSRNFHGKTHYGFHNERRIDLLLNDISTIQCIYEHTDG